MSIYKDKRSPYYSYDFQVKGSRFHGSTKAKSKREAEAVERELKRQAKLDVERLNNSGIGPLTLDIAAGRYFEEEGRHHSGAVDTFANLNRLIEFFGAAKRLNDISDDDVSRLVTWRRGQTVKGRDKDGGGKPVMKAIAPATVNRSTTKVLRVLFGRARRKWGYKFDREPNWSAHVLKEPDERVRELHGHEGEALDAAIRADYAPWLEFARLTGLRLQETLIMWSNVNWLNGQIRTLGKGGKWVTTPITADVRELLEPLRGDHPVWVFTYIAQRTRVCPRTRERVIKGQRYPISYSGAKSVWKRTRKAAGLADFRFHDIRHDVATKVLRATGNLKLVQRVLNHSNIKTTARYAHVLDEDVRATLESLATSRRRESKENPRKNTRKLGKNAS